MKKKLIAILILCITVCVVLTGLTACSHEHNYNGRRIGEKYLATKATCTEKAKYYYSCDCGELDIETFEHGAPLDHAYGDFVSNGDGTHTKTCKNDSTHKITEDCSGGTATYTEKAICDICNTEYGELAPEYFIFALNEDNSSYTVNIFTEEIYYSYDNEDDFFADYEEIISLKEIMIPSKYNGLPVTAIGDFSFIFMNFESISIPDSVTSIGDWAFSVCSSLTKVTIGDSVTSIGDSAFKYCWSLTSIEIPDSVTSIGSDAFSDCSSITSVTIGNSVTSIGELAFYNCSSLTSVTIGNSVTSIGNSAFAWCVSLTSIEIPDSVTSIGNYAFRDCSSLTSIEIPDSVTSIGDYAFYDCSSLEYTEKEGLKYLGNDNNRYLYLADTVSTDITTANIDNHCRFIGYDAFEYCSSLTSIEIPNSVASIDSYAFYGCSSLTSIEIPDSVTSIGAEAFAVCSKLKYIYCEAESQPDGWSINWKASCSATVVWGYKGN